MDQKIEWTGNSFHARGGAGGLTWRIDVTMAEEKTPDVSGTWHPDWTWKLQVVPAGLSSGDRAVVITVEGSAGGSAESLEAAKKQASAALGRVVDAFSTRL